MYIICWCSLRHAVYAHTNSQHTNLQIQFTQYYIVYRHFAISSNIVGRHSKFASKLIQIQLKSIHEYTQTIYSTKQFALTQIHLAHSTFSGASHTRHIPKWQAKLNKHIHTRTYTYYMYMHTHSHLKRTLISLGKHQFKPMSVQREDTLNPRIPHASSLFRNGSSSVCQPQLTHTSIPHNPPPPPNSHRPFILCRALCQISCKHLVILLSETSTAKQPTHYFSPLKPSLSTSW